MKKLVKIPSDVNFHDLKLKRHNTGDLEFCWDPLEKICLASQIDLSLLKLTHEDNVAGFIIQWYLINKAKTGEINSVMEDLISETAIEYSKEQTYSFSPGQA